MVKNMRRILLMNTSNLAKHHGENTHLLLHFIGRYKTSWGLKCSYDVTKLMDPHKTSSREERKASSSSLAR